MKNPIFKNSEKGFSILSVLIASVIAGIVLSMAISIMTRLSKGQKRAESLGELQTIRDMLLQGVDCEATFSVGGVCATAGDYKALMRRLPDNSTATMVAANGTRFGDWTVTAQCNATLDGLVLRAARLQSGKIITSTNEMDYAADPSTQHRFTFQDPRSLLWGSKSPSPGFELCAVGTADLVTQAGSVLVGTNDRSLPADVRVRANDSVAQILMQNSVTGSLATDGSNIEQNANHLLLNNQEASGEISLQVGGFDRLRLSPTSARAWDRLYVRRTGAGLDQIDFDTTTGSHTIRGDQIRLTSLAGSELFFANEATNTTSLRNHNFIFVGPLGTNYLNINPNASSHRNDHFYFTNSAGTLLMHLDGPTNTLRVQDHLVISGNATKPGGGVWNVPSDRRLKDIIGKFEKGLPEINALKTVRFRYNEKSGFDPNIDYVGLIAQELREVFPESVQEEKSGFLSIDTTAVTWAMVNAIQELSRRLDKLVSSFRSQESEIEQLKKQNALVTSYLCAKEPQAPFCKP